MMKVEQNKIGKIRILRPCLNLFERLMFSSPCMLSVWTRQESRRAECVPSGISRDISRASISKSRFSFLSFLNERAADKAALASTFCLSSLRSGVEGLQRSRAIM